MADHRLPLPHMSASLSSAKRMTQRPLICAYPPEEEHETWPHLHHLQLLQALLHQLLYLPLVLDRLVLAERVPCSPLRVFSEIVRCELLALSEELAVLSRKVVNISVFWDTRAVHRVLRPLRPRTRVAALTARDSPATVLAGANRP